MYLVKNITTGFGIDADCWDVNNVHISGPNGGPYKAAGNVSLFVNATALLAGKNFIDNVRFSFTDLTDAELDGNTRQAIVSRLMASNVVDGQETNLFSTSHSGMVSFQDAVIQS